MDTLEVHEEQERRSRLPIVIPAVVLGLLAAGYAGLCAFAGGSDTLWRGTRVLDQDVGGLTAEQAARKLSAAVPGMAVDLYLYDGAQGEAPERSQAPDAQIPLADLGAQVDAAALVRDAQAENRSGGFFTYGWRYLTGGGAACGATGAISLDGNRTAAAARSAADALSFPAQDTSYSLEDSQLVISMAEDGRSVDASALAQALKSDSWSGDLTLNVPYSVDAAQPMTAQQIYDETSCEMKNAGYDAQTQSIIPEQAGAEFNAALAQSKMDAAAPGETVTVPAQIEYPAVTAQQLKGVLFRDVLGSYTTHVGGTAARISNVKLASASVNGTVLNSGDIFDYNEVVGQRTAARGYQAAPAYVKGETVDEIGGGVCQPSSTLYLATLKSNLEIVERYAHRYVPAYIPKGMDATVSWGGPNYRFRNNTDYPIRIDAVYSKGYLTMTLYGTKTDDITVKMTNKVLSSTEFQTVYEDDPTLPAGTEKVKTTPYTGYKVETYRNLYDGNGKLISSTFEALSDYKSRNKVILRGPALPADPAGSGGTDIPVSGPDQPGEEPETPAVDPTPVTPPEITEPVETPADPGTDPAPVTDPGAVISPLPAV